MKVLSVAVLISLLGLVSSCRKSGDLKKEGIQLHQCKDIRLSGESVTLCFDELVSDSRCPVNAMCIWEGAAVANFTFTKDQQSHRIRLATSILPGPERPDTVIAGYKIELLDIEPYPQQPPVHFPESDVRAKVKVTRL